MKRSPIAPTSVDAASSPRSGKSFVSSLSLALAGVVGAMAAAEARAAVWINEGGANTPETAYLWSATANWQDGAKPAATGTIADFAQFGVAAGALRFVRLDEPTTSGRINSHASETLCILGDGENELLGGGGSTCSGTSTGQASLRIYATYKGTGNECNFSHVDFCGKVWQDPEKIDASGYSFRANGGQMRQRYDLYALQAGGTRRNEGGTYAYQYAWGGNLEWIAPKGSATDLTANWTLAADSPFARLAEGESTHDLCAGTIVTAANGALPEGTYLKRIFSDGLIELSNPASAGGATALTFKAITQSVYQFVDQINTCIGKSGSLLYNASKHRAEDDLRIDIRHATFSLYQSKPETNRIRFSTTTDHPGTFVFHNADGVKTVVELDRCHLELAGRSTDPAAGWVDYTHGGFPNAAAMRLVSATSNARLTVTNNITAEVSVISNIVGTLTKDGAGILQTQLLNSKNGSGAINNSGSLVIEEGLLSVTNEGRSAVASLTIKAGATLKLAGEFEVTTFTPEAGAVISGGTLLLPAKMDLSGVTFADGARWALAAPVKANAGEVMNAVKTVPGVPTRVAPAFWLDARAADSFTYADETAATDVTRWSDWRSEGTHFATNVAGVFPVRETDRRGIVRGVRFARQTATKDQIELTDALVWDVPIENIREVFVVVEWNPVAGAQFLGSTMRLADKGTFFQRWADTSTYAAANYVLSSGSPAVARGWQCHLNGVLTDAKNSYDFYFGYSNSNGGHVGGATAHTSATIVHTAPMCFSFNRNGGDDGWADCLSFGTFASNANGSEMISEVLVYTDDLTATERRSIEQYLMAKWEIGDINADRFEQATDRVSALAVDGEYPLAVDAGAYLPVDKVTGSGAFEKCGAGKLYVDDYVNPSGSITVSAGELEIRSVLASKETLPTNAYLHLDACVTDSLVKEGTDVSSWADSRGGAHPVATKHTAAAVTFPQFKADAVGAGLNTVDFGTCFKLNAGPQMNFACGAPSGIRSGFWLVGTQNGGGSFMGGCQSGGTAYNADGGITRYYATDYEVSLSSPLYWTQTARPILHNWLQQKQSVYTRVNGAAIAKGTAENILSGGYDVVSMSTPDYFHTDAISRTHYGSRGGGFELGEEIYYERRLSFEEVDLVDAYLNHKWKGTALPDGFRGAAAKSVTVADGATLTIVGNAPLKTDAVAVAGTVAGAVSLNAGGTLAASVDDEGAVAPLAIDALALGATGTLALTGGKPAPGTQTLCASGVTAADLSGWTVTGAGSSRLCTLYVEDGALKLDVKPTGVMLYLE